MSHLEDQIGESDETLTPLTLTTLLLPTHRHEAVSVLGPARQPPDGHGLSVVGGAPEGLVPLHVGPHPRVLEKEGRKKEGEMEREHV